jgi:hypothetical protein
VHWLALVALVVFLPFPGIAERMAGVMSTAAEDRQRRRVARRALAGGAWVAALASAIGFVVLSTGSTVLALTWDWPPGRVVVSVALVLLSLWLIVSYASSTTGPRQTLLTGRGAARLYVRYGDSAADKMAVGHALEAIAEMVTLNAAAFAVVTHALLRNVEPALTADGSVADPEPVELMWFYSWRLINGLPGSPMETLSIEEPFKYTARWVGVLVLLYFFAVVTPAIAFLRELVKWRRNGAESAPVETSGEPPSPERDPQDPSSVRPRGSE